MVQAGVLEQRDADVGLGRVGEQVGEGDRRPEVDARAEAELLGEPPQAVRVAAVGPEEEQVGAVELGEGANQGLAPAVLRRRAVVEHQGGRADPERGPEVLDGAGLLGWWQIGQVPDHRRAPFQAVLPLQRLGDPVRDGDHGVAAGDDQALDRADQRQPGARVIRDPRGELVRVVEEQGARSARRDPAGSEHRGVVGVDHVGALAGSDPGDPRRRQRPPRTAGKPLGPARRCRRAQLVAVPRSRLRLLARSWQVDDDDIVAGLRQRFRLAAHPGVVLDRLVEQHRDPHRS